MGGQLTPIGLYSHISLVHNIIPQQRVYAFTVGTPLRIPNFLGRPGRLLDSAGLRIAQFPSPLQASLHGVALGRSRVPVFRCITLPAGGLLSRHLRSIEPPRLTDTRVFRATTAPRPPPPCAVGAVAGRGLWTAALARVGEGEKAQDRCSDAAAPACRWRGRADRSKCRWGWPRAAV